MMTTSVDDGDVDHDSFFNERESERDKDFLVTSPLIAALPKRSLSSPIMIRLLARLSQVSASCYNYTSFPDSGRASTISFYPAASPRPSSYTPPAISLPPLPSRLHEVNQRWNIERPGPRGLCPVLANLSLSRGHVPNLDSTRSVRIFISGQAVKLYTCLLHTRLEISPAAKSLDDLKSLTENCSSCEFFFSLYLMFLFLAFCRQTLDKCSFLMLTSSSRNATNIL